LVLALSHGAERSGEQRKNKCPGKTTAVGFGIVPRSGAERSGAGNRERINVQGRLLLLVSALSHGAERSGEQRKNKCPGKTTAVGFGIVPLPPANKPAFTVYTFVFLSYQRFPVLFLQVCPASKDFLSFVVFCTS
jgi:hypothetical protein